MSKKSVVTVKNTEELRTAMEAGHTKDEIEIAAPDVAAATTAAHAEGHAEGLKAGRSESTSAAVETAVKAERARIEKIQSMARAGFETELKAAIDGGDSPEKFAMTLISVAQDRGITLDAIKKDAPKPAPHSKPGETVVGGGANPNVNSTDIYAGRRVMSGHAKAA